MCANCGLVMNLESTIEVHAYNDIHSDIHYMFIHLYTVYQAYRVAWCYVADQLPHLATNEAASLSAGHNYVGQACMGPIIAMFNQMLAWRKDWRWKHLN